MSRGMKKAIIKELKKLIYYPKCPECGGRCINKGAEEFTEKDWEKVYSFVEKKLAKYPSDEVLERDRLKGEFECIKCGKIFRVEIIPKYS